MADQVERLALVEYIGAKIASFTVSFSRNGRTINRLWANVDNEKSQKIKKRRWLPEAEARFYNALPDFRILKWGTEDRPSAPRTPIISRTADFSAPIPEPEALPLSAILQQQAAAMLKAAPPDAIVTKTVEEVKPTYVMSSSGTVHRPSCSLAGRIKEPKEFYTMEDVVSSPDFKKWHKCCDQ